MAEKEYISATGELLPTSVGHLVCIASISSTLKLADGIPNGDEPATLTLDIFNLEAPEVLRLLLQPKSHALG